MTSNTGSIGIAQTQRPRPGAASVPRVRILHLIPTLEGGGAERQLSYLAEAHAAAGHEVHLGLLRHGPNSGRVQRAGVTIHLLSNRGNHDPALLWRVHRLMRAVDPDIVQTWLPQMDVIGGSVAWLRGVPWILSERSSGLAYRPTLKTLLRLAVGRSARLIVANSKGGVEHWAATNARSKLLVVPNAIPFAELAIPSAVEAARPSPSSKPGRACLLYVGRLSAEKNLANLVAALSTVLEPLNADALLCGDGPERPDLERQIEAAGMGDRIRLLGYRDDVASLLRRATALVFVSVFEGQPNTVLEAMAARCPLVVSDIPAHRAFLSEESAMFVDPRDPSSIATGITRTLSDLRSARKRALRAHDIAAQQTVQHIAARYEEIYARPSPRLDAALVRRFADVRHRRRAGTPAADREILGAQCDTLRHRGPMTKESGGRTTAAWGSGIGVSRSSTCRHRQSADARRVERSISSSTARSTITASYMTSSRPTATRSAARRTRK